MILGEPLQAAPLKFGEPCNSGSACAYTNGAENTSLTMACSSGTIGVSYAFLSNASTRAACTAYIKAQCQNKTSCAFVFNNTNCKTNLPASSKKGAASITCSAPPPAPGAPSKEGYTLIFNDEFENRFGGGVNTAQWDYDMDVINKEEQCFTTSRNNVRVENRVIDGRTNGVLVLQARKESNVCAKAEGRTYAYTSGGLKTKRRDGVILKDMSFGHYEIRAKVPAGRGTWPAIWLVGQSAMGGWPNSGEIDIMEYVGYEEERGVYQSHSTLHRNGGARPWPTKIGGTGMGHTLRLPTPLSADFHVFSMDWNPTSLAFYVDGIVVSKRTIDYQGLYEIHNSFARGKIANSGDALGWPWAREGGNHTFHMILSLAFGGGWGGLEGTDPTIFEKRDVEFLVDYVRVYKKTN